MKIKLSQNSIYVGMITLLVFLNMEPFFAWKTVSMFGYRLYTAVILAVTVLMGFQLLRTKKIIVGKTVAIDEKVHIPLPLFLSSALVVFLIFYEMFISGVKAPSQQPFNLAMICIHLGLMFFLLQDNITLRKVFLGAKTLFAISLIPSIIVFLLLQIGVNLPSTSLLADPGKELVGQSYKLYFFSSVLTFQNGAILNRLCGLFREPGFVGTLGALFLFGDTLSLKKWQNVVIIIACLMTFSLAFVVLFLFGLLLRAMGNLTNKRTFFISVAAIAVVVVGYFVFMGLSLDENTSLGRLQARMEITDGGLAGDNRFTGSDMAEQTYQAFLDGDLKTKMLGYGTDDRTIPGTQISIWQTIHSYKEFVFAFGFVGFAIMLLCFLLPCLTKYRQVPKNRVWSCVVLAILFFVSIYQRYLVVNFHYFCILFGGLANLALMGGNQDSATGDGSQEQVAGRTP